jgi:hypothetical protein
MRASIAVRLGSLRVLRTTSRYQLEASAASRVSTMSAAFLA